MIKKHELNDLKNQLIDFLEPISDTFDIVLHDLGSIRQMRQSLQYNTIKSKDETKDLDVLIVSKSNVLTNELDVLKTHLNDAVIDYNVHFGNVVTFYFIFNDNPVHIDLMIAAKNIYVTNYLTTLRFYSNEKFDKNNHENFKGLHRTELIRSFLKSHGFILGDTSLKRYILKDEFKTLKLDILRDVLTKKANRAKKQETTRTYEYLKSFTITDWFNFLNNRIEKDNDDWYLTNRYNLFGITDYKLNKLIVELLFDRKTFDNHAWNYTLKKYINLEFNFNDNFDTFETTLKSLQYVVNPENLQFILSDYIAELQRKNVDYYFTSVFELIHELYPFIEIPEPILF